MKVIALALLAPVIGTVGQLLLKIGMDKVGPLGQTNMANPVALLQTVFSNPWIILAIPLYVAGFLLWLVVLSKLDLSYAYPFLALAYVLVPLCSRLLLGEQIPSLRWIGIGVICMGIVLVGWAR